MVTILNCAPFYTRNNENRSSDDRAISARQLTMEPLNLSLHKISQCQSAFFFSLLRIQSAGKSQKPRMCSQHLDCLIARGDCENRRAAWIPGDAWKPRAGFDEIDGRFREVASLSCLLECAARLMELRSLSNPSEFRVAARYPRVTARGCDYSELFHYIIIAVHRWT